jgi:hypothetical protein
MTIARSFCSLVVFGMLFVPLRAQEPPSNAATPAVPAETPSPPPATKDETPEPTVEIDPTEERVSADNNLTFPVDI